MEWLSLDTVSELSSSAQTIGEKASTQSNVNITAWVKHMRAGGTREWFTAGTQQSCCLCWCQLCPIPQWMYCCHYDATMMPGDGCCSYLVDETRYISLPHPSLLLDPTLDNLMPFPEHTLAVLSSSRITNTKYFCWRVSVFVISFFSTKILDYNCIFPFMVMYDLLLCKDRDHLCVRKRENNCLLM